MAVVDVVLKKKEREREIMFCSYPEKKEKEQEGFC